jgi:hypothetical protein
MAYKNQKKNKRIADEQRKKHSRFKHEKKRERYNRRHPIKAMSFEEMEAIISKL